MSIATRYSSVTDSVIKIIMVLIASVTTVIGIEYSIRWLGLGPTVAEANRHFIPNSEYAWNQPDPILGWRNKPGVVKSLEPGHVPMTFWEDGRRATRPASSMHALPQVVFIGSSWTQGYGVVDEETYAYRLAALAPGWNVENFGTGGYGSYQSLLMLKRIFSEKKYAPKLVIYGYLDLHARRDVANYSWIRKLRNVKGEIFAPPNVVADAGRLVEHRFTLFPLWPFETDYASVAIAKRAYIKLVFLRRKRYEDEVTKIILTEMRNLSANNGARFVIMKLTSAPKSIEAFIKAGGFDVADCPEFDPELKTESNAFQVGGTGHPNDKAHESWARCINHWINQHQTLITVTPR